LISAKIDTKKNFNIIYSYCTRESFKKNGVFYDKYFNYSSKKKNIYWFLISLDNYIPHKIKNISIIYKKNNIANFIKFFQLIFKNLFKRNTIHKTNNTSLLSSIFADFFYKTFKTCSFNLYIPYENRPHQNAIIKKAKIISKKNKVYGYYHRMPEPLQLEMIHKLKTLDKLYVCSEIQKNVFTKYLSWPSKKLEIINSLRYLKFYKRKNVIFLPYNIEDPKFLLKKLKTLLLITETSIRKYSISIHNLNKRNKKHLRFKSLITDISSKNKKDLDAPIILGEPGGVAAEMLDTIGKVYHISNRNLNIFSEKIWKNIKVKKLSDSVFVYSKLNNKKFLNLNGKKNNFENLLKKNRFLKN